MKKKILIVCLICTLGLSACSSSSDTEAAQDTQSVETETETQTESETPEVTQEQESEPEISEEPEEDPLGFNVMFSATYRNDTTGNWRLARIAEDIDIENYAVDYYNNYFTSDDEIHIIINFTRNTTTRINKLGNLLDVTIMEYVDGEEHDAKIACSGDLLAEYQVDIDSGEIEKIQ